jgi:hypothetical protein
MSQSTKVCCVSQVGSTAEGPFVKRPRKPKTKRLAVVGFACKDLGEVDLGDLERLLRRAESQGYDYDYFPAMPIGTGPHQRMHYAREGEWDDYSPLVSKLRAGGYTSVLVVAGGESRALRIFLGHLVEAGMEVRLLGLRGKVVMTQPGTVRWRKNEETGVSEPTQEVWGIPGHWEGVPQSLAGRWVSESWTYEELADSVYTSETMARMWREKDYATMETAVAVYAVEWVNGCVVRCPVIPTAKELEQKPGRYRVETRVVDLKAPVDAVYPHDLNLLGFAFRELPLRTLDWLVGQPWLFGELRAKLLRYHASRPVQAALERLYLLVDEKELEKDTAFSPTGYYEEEGEEVTYHSTGTAGKQVRKSGYGTPTWLVPRNRFGQALGARGFEEADDPKPEGWMLTTPWGFENVSQRRDPVETGDTEDIVDRKNLLAEEYTAEENWEDWEPREPRCLVPEEIAEEMRRGRLEWIARRGSWCEDEKEREELRGKFRRLRERIPQWMLDKAKAKAEANAWYEGLEVLQGLENLRDWMREGMVVRRTAKDEGNAREGEVVGYDLRDEAAWLEYNARLEEIRARVSPELARGLWVVQRRPTKEWVLNERSGRKEWRVRAEAEASFLARLREVRKEIDTVWERNQVRRRFPESCVRADLAVSACRDNPGFVNALAQDAPGTLRLAAWLHPGEIERLPGKLRRYESMGMKQLLTAMKRQPWHGRRPRREKTPEVQA